MMEKFRGNSWFLRVLALVMAIGLLVGAVPVAALDGDAQADDANSFSEAETVTEDPSVTDEADDASVEEPVGETGEDVSEAEELAEKEEADIAPVSDEPENEGVNIKPEDVVVNIVADEYSKAQDYYYTGIKDIVITIPKTSADENKLKLEKIKAVFAQGVSKTDGYDSIPWWQDTAGGDEKDDYSGFVSVTESTESFYIVMNIDQYVDKKYDSDFADEKADGVYTLIFPFDADDEGEPILYSKQVKITNAAPKLDVNAGDISGWKSAKCPVNYVTTDSGAGIDTVILYQYYDGDYHRRATSTKSSGTLYVPDSGTYYMCAVDKLGLVSEYKYVGDFKIDKEQITFDEDVTYDKAAPGSDEWVSTEVKATVKLNETPSGVKSVKVKETGEEAESLGDGKYAVTFTDAKDLTVVATSNADKSTGKTVAAPQIDTANPDKSNIKSISVKSSVQGKILHLLTFGIYDNKELTLTVNTVSSGAPITEINVDDDRVEKVGEMSVKDGVASQAFKISVGSDASDSDFTGIKFTLKNQTGKETETPIALKDIEKITVDAEETVELAGDKLGELINSRIAPTVDPIVITSDDFDGDIYHKNVKIDTTVHEELTGLSSVKVWLDTVDKFDADNKYQPKDGAKEISDCVSAISTDSKTKSATVKYTVDDSAASGEYVLYIEAVNNSLNTMPEYKLFTIDKEAPVIEVQELPDDWTNDKEMTVKFTVTDQYVGVDKVTVKEKDTSKEVEWELGSDGVYSFKPEAGKDYVIDASDKFSTAASDSGLQKEKSYDQVHFDDQAPNISAFTYINNKNDDNKDWSDKVTVKFTVDDKFDGKSLSGVDPSTFTLMKVDEDGNETPTSSVIVPVKVGDGYECSFEVLDNYTAYTVNVSDMVGNPAVTATTETILRDAAEPSVEMIKFMTGGQARKFGVYGADDLVAVVYTKTGHTAKVEDIKLFNSTGDSKEEITSDNDVQTTVENDVEYFTKAFQIPYTEGGKTFDKLGVYALSEAGVHTKNDTADGIVGIASINVLVNDEALEKYEGLFEAVAKTTGPNVIEIGFKYPDTHNGAQGYVHDENGEVTEFGSFTFKVEDPVAGVDTDIVTYFDKVSNFTENEDGVFIPKEGAKKLEGVEWNHTTDNEDKKNTVSTATYTESAVTESGQYVLCVVAKNLCNVSRTASTRIDIDNTEPTITVDSYSYVAGRNPVDKWVNQDVTVTFSIVDGPAGYAGGVDHNSIKVVGDIDGKSYDFKDGAGNTYTFTTNIAQTYTISAADKFNIKAKDVSTEKIKVDKEPAEIIIKADDLNKYQTEWSADKKVVSFTVNDISKYDGFEKDEDKRLSGVKTITVTDSDGNTYDLLEPVAETADEKTYSFEADFYENYIIEVFDEAGNPTVNTELTNIAVDTKKPYVTNVSFASKKEGALGKVFNFLTFGLFSSETVVMTVTAKDDAASSKLDKITVEGLTTKLTSQNVTGGQPDDSEIVSVFELDPEDISTGVNIEYRVADIATQESTISLSKLYDDGLVDVPDGFKFGKKDFEVVISTKRPVVSDTVTLTPNDGTTMKVDDKGTYWFSDHLNINVDVEDTTSHLHSVDVKMNDTSILDKVVDENGDPIPEYYTVFNMPAEAPGNQTEPVDRQHITVDTSALNDAEILKKISSTDDKNVLKVIAQANNGLKNQPEEVASFMIDDVAPDITGFSFSGKVNELTGETATQSEIGKALSGTSYTAMTDDNFIYFFEEEAKVTVSATDTHKVGGKDIAGSGVKEIHFYTVGKSNVNAAVEVTEYSAKVKDDNFGNMSADFTVPAGFKGSIFAYAVDQVNNKGTEYSPNNLIVENKDIHDSSNDTSIDISADKLVGTDNNGHNLYNGDVELTLSVEDWYSGIKSIRYTAVGLEDSAVLEKDVTVDIDGNNNDGWTVTDKEKNLVYRMTKTITLDGFGAFNSNDIVITLTGVDRSGYALKQSTQTISIDTTKPVIEVTYDPAAGSGNTYGTDEYEYFKVSRTMTVTVYERNFDPAKFDYTGIVNNYVSGDVPSLTAVSDWNTDYTDYKGAAAHVCSFTFANDGDYEIKLVCTDEANNVSDEYTGEKFTIDNIDPTVEVSLSGTVNNGKYYNTTVTATITVNEHNFAEGDTYVTFTPTTSFDTSYDTTSVTPSISGWSGSGDTHTTTIEFTSDGTYSFTFDYKDKALRNAQQFSQSEFVIDKNIDKMIKFIDVEDKTAYDGTIAPKVSFDDTNLDAASTSLTRISLDTDDLKQTTAPANDLSHGMNPTTGSSRTDSYANFPEEVGNDGIYLLEATGSDLAGNSKTEQILFSVNRFGSTFMLSEESREWVEVGYTKEALDLEIIEINVNEVTDQKISVSHNSRTENLDRMGKFDITSNGGEENWYQYNYNIYKSNFAEEGDYNVTVSSTDTFKNSVSNRTAYEDEEEGIIKTCPVAFVVDQTDPIVSISGVVSDEPYGDPERTVHIICTDVNLDPESLVITDENDHALEKDVEYSVEEMPGELDIELIVDEAGKHSLSVNVSDYAQNDGMDEVTNFELNASIFTLFFHNTVVVVCTAIALAAIVAFAIFMILRKRKSQEQQ